MATRDQDTGLPGTVHRAADPGGLARLVADWLVARAERTATPTGDARFGIALSGGSTPRLLYERLAAPPYADLVEWARWQVFFADERACPPDDPQSNIHLAATTLLDHVAVNPQQVHRMEAEAVDLDAAAARYSTLLERLTERTPPRLDVILLGLGENGHTASLFPGSPALSVTDSWATRGLADYEPYDRITLTYPAINAARAVAFLVTGSSKREALNGVRDGSVPAAYVRPHPGELHWFLDAAALRSLD